jgi:hypothetical protein
MSGKKSKMMRKRFLNPETNKVDKSTKRRYNGLNHVERGMLELITATK